MDPCISNVCLFLKGISFNNNLSDLVHLSLSTIRMSPPTSQNFGTKRQDQPLMLFLERPKTQNCVHAIEYYNLNN